jgi:RNA polymerase sigma factor (sigma-70 family)
MEVESPSLAETLAAAARGEQWAGEQLVRRYERLVWSVVRHFRLENNTAWDVYNTVFLRLWEHADRIRQPEALPGWLATTARNEAMRAIRNQRRQVPTDFEYDVADPALSPFDEALIEDEEVASVVTAFKQLEERCQELLTLLVVEPRLDYETVASLLGKPTGYIGPTRGRCIEKLRRIMERRRSGGDDAQEVGR